MCMFLFFFKQKTAYELRISDWSSDVCSSDLDELRQRLAQYPDARRRLCRARTVAGDDDGQRRHRRDAAEQLARQQPAGSGGGVAALGDRRLRGLDRKSVV